MQLKQLGDLRAGAGTVVDQRTGRPVARARVEATAPQMATVTGSTDAQGRFTLRQVSKQATLKVTAANYQLASLPVGKGPLEVKLTPIPVIGRVTSGLTRAGLGGHADPDASRRQLRGLRGGPGRPVDRERPWVHAKSITIGAGRVEVILSPEPATEVNQINQWVRAGNLAAVWRFHVHQPAGLPVRGCPCAAQSRGDEALRRPTGGQGL